MSTFVLDLLNPQIAPTPAREARVGVVAVIVVVALVIWRVDQPWLQILISAAVAGLYGVRISIAARRQKRQGPNPGH